MPLGVVIEVILPQGDMRERPPRAPSATMPSSSLPIHQKAHPSQEQVTGRAFPLPCPSGRAGSPPNSQRPSPIPTPNDQTVTDSCGGTLGQPHVSTTSSRHQPVLVC